MQLRARALAVFLYGWSTYLCAADDLGPLTAVAKRFKVPSHTLSALVQDVHGARPILALNPTVPRNPASSIKLLTTFVALDALGPTYTWPTEVYALGPRANGVLRGDLLLKGYGDPYLVEENLWKLLGELRRTGLKDIKGDLLLDDSYFAPPAIDPGAFDGQAYRLYNVQPSALMVNFKAVTLVFAPRADGNGVVVRTRPALPNFKITNQVKLEHGRCRGLLGTVAISVPDPQRADAITVSGRYQTGCGEQLLPRTFMTPTTYTLGLFRQLWAQWGGTLEGGVRHARDALF
jgi:serine-type D-Ala-D-Ala carboxypeptidase/endopeptidase (penicillin-binding protein 4)